MDETLAVIINLKINDDKAKQQAQQVVSEMKKLCSDNQFEMTMITNTAQALKDIKDLEKKVKDVVKEPITYEFKSAKGNDFTLLSKESKEIVETYVNKLEGLDSQMDKISTRFDTVKNMELINKEQISEVYDLQEALKGLQQQYDGITTGAIEIDKNSFDTFKTGVSSISQSLVSITTEINSNISGTSMSFDKLQSRAQNLLSNLQIFENKNPNYTTVLNEELKELEQHIRSIADGVLGLSTDRIWNKSDIANFNKNLSLGETKLSSFKKQVTEAGGTVKSFWQIMSENISKYTQFELVTKLLQQVKSGFVDIYESVKNLDTAMVELKKVTDETSATYSNFLTSASNKATKLATTVTDLTQTTAEFAKLGYSIQDALTLAETATIYSNVGDLSIEDATKNIVSIMKSFNIEASEAITIVDKLNEVGNKYAVSSADLGTALEDSASALQSSNNSLAQSIALITGMNEIAQDVSKTSTALRTISTRLRNTSVELQALGEDSEGAATTMSGLRSSILALSGVDIMLDANTYKGTYDILEELSEVWLTLEDSQQAALTSLIAGTRQTSTFNAILTNFSAAQSALETALDSTGSAAKENEKYIDSIEGKWATLNSSLQIFANNVLSSELVKFFISIASGTVQAANAFGSLNVAIGLLVATLGTTKLFPLISQLIDYIALLPTVSTNAKVAIVNLANATGMTKVVFAGILGVIAAVTAKLAIWAGSSIIQWLDDLNVTLDEHLELLENAKSAYSEQQTVVDELADKIAKLKETIEGVSSGELSLDNGQTIQNLERQLELQELLYELEQQRLENAKMQIQYEAESSLPKAYNAYEAALYAVTQSHEDYIKAVEAASNGDEKAYATLTNKEQAYSSANAELIEAMSLLVELTGQIDGQTQSGEMYNKLLDQTIAKYRELQNSFGDASTTINQKTSYIVASVDDLSSVMEELEDSTDLLSSAYDDMDSNGSLSLGTVKDLIDANKAYLLVIDEETGAIKLNTAAMKAEILARVNDEIAALEAAMVTNKNTIAALENEKLQHELTTEQIKLHTQALNELKTQEQSYQILHGIYNSIVNDTYLQTSSSSKSSSSSTNTALENYKKLLSHREKMNKYYMKENDYINDLIYAYQKLCQTAEERQEIEEMIYEAQQDYNERLLGEYENQQEDLEKMIDYATKIIKQSKEDEKDAIEEVTEAYEKQYKARKKALQDEQNNEEYAAELAKKQKAVTDIEAKLIALQYDDSAEAAKKRLQLEEELAEAREELEEYQRERYYQEQEDALDDEMERFEESQQEKIDIIDDYLSDEQHIRNDAIASMQEDYGEFYKTLEEYCNKYEGSVSEDIKNAWETAQVALNNYNQSQLQVVETLEDLIAKQKELSEVLEPTYYTEGGYGSGSSGSSSGSISTSQGSYYLTDTALDNYETKVHDIIQRVNAAESDSDRARAQEDVNAYLKSIGNYILQQPAVISNPTATQFYGGLYNLLKKYQVTQGYLSGGVVENYGLAMLHGNKLHSEVVFSSEDAKKLWNTIHSLPEFFSKRTDSDMSQVTSQDISFGTIMPITIEAGATVTDEAITQLRNIATQLKQELMETLNKTGYRSNVALRRF